MSDTVSDRLTHYQNATENDSVIKAETIGVGAVGSFSTGWIDYNFMYEKPRILLDLDTEIGGFQLEIGVDELDENPILSLFDENNRDIRNLVGEQLYIAPNEQFNRACFSDSNKVSFSQDNSHIIRSGDDNRQNVRELNMDTDMKMSGVQKMPLGRMNHILRMEIQRRFNGEYGWIKTEVEMLEDENEVQFVSDIQDGVNTVTWSFSNTVNSYENIKGFLDDLNLGFILTEGSGEVWVKPVRSIHFSNRPDETDLVSDSQTWIISSQPMKPEKDTPSILDRIKGFFSTSDDVSVSVGRGRSTKSKIADSYTMYEESCYCEGSESVPESMETEIV